MTRKKIPLLALLLAVFALVFLLAGCSDPEDEADLTDHTADDFDYIVLATTLEDTALLNFLISAFTDETGWGVMTVPTSNASAFELGRNADADVLLVNSPALEWQFTNQGYAEGVYDVLFNDLIVVGPTGSFILPNYDVLNTFDQILFFNLPFISRGDGSSVHLRELQLWSGFYFNQWNNPFYSESAMNMNATLNLAVEMSAFTLTDRATWLSFPETGNLIAITEEDFRLGNRYAAIAVAGSDMLHEAEMFVYWITGPVAQEIIRDFGLEEHGVSLYTPAG